MLGKSHVGKSLIGKSHPSRIFTGKNLSDLFFITKKENNWQPSITIKNKTKNSVQNYYHARMYIMYNEYGDCGQRSRRINDTF